MGLTHILAGRALACGPPKLIKFNTETRRTQSLIPATSSPWSPCLHGEMIFEGTTDFVLHCIRVMAKLRNVTVTLEEEVARWARLEAARNDTSVSRLLGDV